MLAAIQSQTVHIDPFETAIAFAYPENPLGSAPRVSAV